MMVNTDDVRYFFEKHGGNLYANENLDGLVSRYKETNDSEILASICQKTIGIISFHAKKLKNPEFTESDAYSHGFERLYKAILDWDPKRGVSFKTLLYRYIHNDLDTLAHRSKQYRFYIHKTSEDHKKMSNYSEVSLDEILEENGDSIYNSMPTVDLYCEDLVSYKNLFSDRPLSRKIIEFLSCKGESISSEKNLFYFKNEGRKKKFGIKSTNKKDMAMCLNVTMKELNCELKFIKKQIIARKLV